MENKPKSFLDWVHHFEDSGEFPSEEVKKAYEDYRWWQKDVDLNYTEQGWANVCGCKNELKRLLSLV